MANTPNINLVKPLGTDKALVSVINDNSDKIDAFAGSTNTNMANTQNGYAIVVDGNNAPKAITAGQYLFIKNHSTLSAGGYHATANIANGAAITSSNVAADADGVVNGAFSALNSKFTTTLTVVNTYILLYKSGNCVTLIIDDGAYSINSSGALTVDNDVVTLPESFRPPRAVSVFDTYNKIRFIIDTLGNIKTNESTLPSQYVRFSASWLVF